jgi:hypothetical protein
MRRSLPFPSGGYRLLATGCGVLVLAEIAVVLFPELQRAWLAASLFWSAIPAGAVGLLMLMRLVPGAWDFELQAPTEAACLLQPLVWLLHLPLLLALRHLFVWTHAEAANTFQGVYLAPGFFVFRTLAWFVFLALMTWLLVFSRRAAFAVSAAGLMVYVLLSSLMAVDWLMSLDPKFHSSGFGLYWLSIQMGIALAWLVAARLSGGRRARQPGLLAAFLLTSLLLWAYLAFMQFFILWSGNLPVGVAWYQARGGTLGDALLWAMAILQGLPLLLLMLPPVNGNRRAVLGLAGLALLGKATEIAWIVIPPVGAGDLRTLLWFAVILCGQGAVFVMAMIAALRFRIGRRAPRVEPVPA